MINTRQEENWCSWLLTTFTTSNETGCQIFWKVSCVHKIRQKLEKFSILSSTMSMKNLPLSVCWPFEIRVFICKTLKKNLHWICIDIFISPVLIENWYHARALRENIYETKFLSFMLSWFQIWWNILLQTPLWLFMMLIISWLAL